MHRTLDIITLFDLYLEARGLRFDAVVIGGAALNLLGVVSRFTKDCDILFPEIPKEIAKTSQSFAREVREKGGALVDEWLNNGPASLQTQLLPGWKNRLQIAFDGQAIRLRSLGREDLLCYLLFAIAALICRTASRLRQVGWNWTRSFRGWSNRTPILSGQRTFA